MSLLFRIARGALVLQSVGNVVAGTRMLLTPTASAATFMIENVEVPKMIGLAMITVGTYSAMAVWKNDRHFYIATIALRCISVAVFLTCEAPWNRTAIYEGVVALLASVAAFVK